MLCNEKGKILEISPSIYNLMKITPKILETLHNSLAENLKISFFNSNLNLQKLDFSKHSCVFFKKIDLEFDELKKLSNNLEILDENEEQIINPFSTLRNVFPCTMKIIKETYGESTSTTLNLYYIIFTDLVELKRTQGSM